MLQNAAEAFKEDLRKISIAFPKAIITVGHIPGPSNPADTMTKIFRDPIAVINFNLYRHGTEKFASKEELGEDVVATCQDGVFTFIGLPTRLLPKPQPKMENCYNCHEKGRCALVQTKAMKT